MFCVVLTANTTPVTQMIWADESLNTNTAVIAISRRAGVQ